VAAAGAPEAGEAGEAEVAAGAPGAEPAPGVVRVRAPALGRAQACVPAPERWERAAAEGRVPVAGREPGSAGDSVAARLQMVSCPGPTAFPRFAGITASHLGRG
jgi:hypothetical protein